MKLERHSLHAVQLVQVVVLLALTSGCAVLKPGASSSLELTGKAEAEVGQAAVAGGHRTASITVEVRADGKKPEIEQVPLDGAPRIQEILEQTGLIKKFRRMDLAVMRSTGGARQKLKSEYDHGEGWVNPLYDYQLHPGDHLIVTEDTSNIFDDMLNSLAQPVRGRK